MSTPCCASSGIRRPTVPSNAPLSPPQALVMNPPKPGQPSYEQFVRERDAIIEVRWRRCCCGCSALGCCCSSLCVLPRSTCHNASAILHTQMHSFCTMQSLKRRAELVVKTFRGLDGVTCNPGGGCCR